MAFSSDVSACAQCFFFLRIEFSNQCDSVGSPNAARIILIRPPAPEEYANKLQYERNEYQ
jgi:hypothetical protein